MANNISADFKEVWATDQQTAFYKNNIANMIADRHFEGQLSSGDTLHRPYRTQPGSAKLYTRGTAMTLRDLVSTDEYLTVNREFYDFFYVDDHDKIQSNYNEASKFGKDGGEMLSNQIDSDVLGEVLNATSYLDAGDVGGTAGQGIALSTTNMPLIFTRVSMKLAKLNVTSKDRFAAVSPEFIATLTDYGVARATILGDSLNRQPDFNNWMGYDIYETNQCTGTAVLSLATQPTTGDTLVINGVTINLVTTIGTTPGNVLVVTNVDTTRANIANFLNDPSTTSANQVALSTANADAFKAHISAVNSNSADTLTVTYKGVGVLVVSETLTDATDAWTSTSQLQHNMFGVKGNPVLVIQEEPNIEFVKVQDKKGYNYMNTVLYGVKTFADNAKQLVDVKIKSSTYTA